MERSYFFPVSLGFVFTREAAFLPVSVNHSHLAGGWGLERTPALSGSLGGPAAPPHWRRRETGRGTEPQSSRAQPSPRQCPEAQADLRVQNSAGPRSWGFPSGLEWPCPIPLPHLPMRTTTLCTLALHLLGVTGRRLSCQVATLPTLPTLNLVTATLLATHSQFLLSIQCP